MAVVGVCSRPFHIDAESRRCSLIVGGLASKLVQMVVPAIARGELIQRPPLPRGSPFTVHSAGRVGITLQPGNIGGRWAATVGDIAASGPRIQLTQIAVLYADVTLAPFAGQSAAPEWVATLTAGRTQLAFELGDAILHRVGAR